MGRQVFGTRMVYRETFFSNPTASSSALYPQESNPWVSNLSGHTSPHVTSERQIPDTVLNPGFQKGPSARNSFDPKEGRFSKNYGQTNNDCRFRIFTLTNSPTQQHLLVGR